MYRNGKQETGAETSGNCRPRTASSKSENGGGFCSSFKSKRYRDKLRSEIKALEALLPIDRTLLHRKLDSQTIFRLVLAYFRSKIFFKALGLASADKEPAYDNKARIDCNVGGNTPHLGTLFGGENLSQLMDGFLLLVSTDGTILYVSENVLTYIGYNQVDLVHRCLYCIVHPDDHYDVKAVMEQSIPANTDACAQEGPCLHPEPTVNESVSVLCRLKCFTGNTAGYVKMHCSGKHGIVRGVVRVGQTSDHLLWLYCRPFMVAGLDADYERKNNTFWSKHDMDLVFRQLDTKVADILGHSPADLEGKSFYSMVHPNDLAACCACHKALTECNSVQSMYIRVQNKDADWTWLHSRGKLVSKGNKKQSIVFSHYPIRHEDSCYIQQEAILRQRYGFHELACLKQRGYHSEPTQAQPVYDAPCEKVLACVQSNSGNCPESQYHHKQHHRHYRPEVDTNGSNISESVQLRPLIACPSSWHAMSERHSPVLPSTHAAHKICQREKQVQYQKFKKQKLEHLEGRLELDGIADVCQTSEFQSRFSECQGHQDKQTNGQKLYNYNKYSLTRPTEATTVETVGRNVNNSSPYTPRSIPSTDPYYNLLSGQIRQHPSGNQLQTMPHASNNYCQTNVPYNYSRFYQTPPYSNECTGGNDHFHMPHPYMMPPSPPPSPSRHGYQTQYSDHAGSEVCTFVQEQMVHVRNVITCYPSGNYAHIHGYVPLSWHRGADSMRNYDAQNSERQHEEDMTVNNGHEPGINLDAVRSVNKRNDKFPIVAPHAPHHHSTPVITGNCADRVDENNLNTYCQEKIKTTSCSPFQGSESHRQYTDRARISGDCVTGTVPVNTMTSCASSPGLCYSSCVDNHEVISGDSMNADAGTHPDLDIPSIGSFLEYLVDI